MDSLRRVGSTKPHGIRFLECIRNRVLTFRTYQAIVWATTFFAFAGYHANKKIPSVVKSVLGPDTNNLLRTSFHNPGGIQNGWAPFDGSGGTALLGQIDLAFLLAYTLGMYVAGHLADRLDLKMFLTVGMLGTALFTVLFGVGYWLNIHSFCFYLVTQLLAGLFQSTGWPSVVAVFGNWFGKSRRGLIMGVWIAHISIGNMVGSLIAAALLKYGWGWSFVIPGLLMALLALTVFLFLPVSPEKMGISKPDDSLLESSEKSGIKDHLLEGGVVDVKEKAVGFLEAWRIPGVAPFALCMFFSKLVLYTFLFWLPFYIRHTAIDGVFLSDSASGTLSTLFDVGGLVGGIIAGHISDKLDAHALTTAGFIYCAAPVLLLYRICGSVSLICNMSLMFMSGMFLMGTCTLIGAVVAAELGTHSSLTRNSRALATVSAIIDGTGSVGAAIGPLLTGYISAKSWNAVFIMLMAATLLAGLPLIRLMVPEVTAKIHLRSTAARSGPSRAEHI